MARITKTRSLEPIIRAAQEWIQKSLIHDRSVFSDESLWTKELVTEVRKAFVENPDSGDNTFSQKLTEQMRPASNSAKRLMAELMWALLLFPTNVKAVTKRQQVRELWETSGEPLPDPPLLRDEVLSGIGSGGTGFNTHRWREMSFLISVTGALKSESSQRRAELLSDYGKFTEWIETLPQDGSRQFRHMLRFFCFPDRVERMCSNSERIDVLQGFKVADRAETEKWSDRQLDEALLQLRTKLQSEQPSEIIDFYDTPWLRRWRSTIEAPTIPSGNMEQLGAKSINQALEDLKEAAVRADQLSLVRFVSALLAKRFVIFSGLAGSGKTKLAQAFAEWISPSISLADPFRVGARIPSDRITYIVKDADRLSVEFWNSEGDNATRVTLPPWPHPRMGRLHR